MHTFMAFYMRQVVKCFPTCTAHKRLFVGVNPNKKREKVEKNSYNISIHVHYIYVESDITFGECEDHISGRMTCYIHCKRLVEDSDGLFSYALSLE